MNQRDRLRVAVLMGGTSSERDISLSTGRQIAQALDKERYVVTAIDTADVFAVAAPPSAARRIASRGDSGFVPASTALAARPSADLDRSGAVVGAGSEPGTADGRPDVVFIALHGKGGEDGSIQGLLEFAGIPYTGSGLLASALAIDKTATKRMLQSEGLTTIPGMTVRRSRRLSPDALAACVDETLGFPVFVKPNAEGSTFGCALARDRPALAAAVDEALRYDDAALIERYVKGIELTVGVLEDPDADGLPTALPVVEIVPRSEYYDFESKYADGGSDHIIPARLPEELQRRAQAWAVRAHEVLGCSGMSRTDMIVANGELNVLEVNTIPGMTPTSLLPQAALAAGIQFPALLDRIIRSALRRTGVNSDV